jgi:hypothetical protein
MILRDAFPVAICRREAELGGGIPLFGLPPEGVRVTGTGGGNEQRREKDARNGRQEPPERMGAPFGSE